MSVDVLTKSEIEETAEINVKYDELISFHLDLWKAGKTDVAITGFFQQNH